MSIFDEVSFENIDKARALLAEVKKVNWPEAQKELENKIKAYEQHVDSESEWGP